MFLSAYRTTRDVAQWGRWSAGNCRPISGAESSHHRRTRWQVHLKATRQYSATAALSSTTDFPVRVLPPRPSGRQHHAVSHYGVFKVACAVPMSVGCGRNRSNQSYGVEDRGVGIRLRVSSSGGCTREGVFAAGRRQPAGSTTDARRYPSRSPISIVRFGLGLNARSSLVTWSLRSRVPHCIPRGPSLRSRTRRG